MKRILPLFILLVIGVAAFWLWPRGPQAAPDPTAEDIALAATARPESAALADIYDRSCAACHATPDALAPLTGHGPGWAPRLAERGMDGLVASARYGFEAMPAMGMCFDCTDAEFHALIAFMANTGDAQ